MIIIRFNEISFKNFKLKSSNNYSDEYFDNLLIEDNQYNRVKYRDAVDEQIDENIHIKITYSLIINVLFFLCIFISIILGLNNLFLFAIITLIIAIILKFINSFLLNRIKEMNIGKEMTKDLVDLIFENR